MFKRHIVLLISLMLPSLTPAELRDPTLPGNLPASPVLESPHTESVFSLTGIWISDTHRRATINGTTVSKGQTLADGSRVLQIKPGYVLIRQNGTDKKLYLVPSIKKPVKRN
ncbi:hypothetical protein ACH50O_05460 [Methylomonas sp. 2BW1-5-20]|uniref:hypothetical protein n=1 Tax=Methylomonas sp. 2BW1-5-20 TaxID=3376686 RepID=UPI0040510E30